MNKILVMACIALSLALFYFKRKHDQCRRELEKQKRLVKSLIEGIELEPSPAEEPSQLMNLATTAITPLISFIGPNLLKKKNDFLKETIDTSDYELSQQMRQLDEIEEDDEPMPAAPKPVPAAPKPVPAARPTPPRPASPPPMVPPEVLLAALWSRQAEALASQPPRTSKITEIFDDPPAVAAPAVAAPAVAAPAVAAPQPEPLLAVVEEVVNEDIVSQLADAVADDDDLPELSDTRDVSGLPDALKREADAIDEEIRQFTHDNEDEVATTVEKPLAAQQAKKNKKRKPLYKHPALQPDFFCQDGVCSIKPK